MTVSTAGGTPAPEQSASGTPAQSSTTKPGANTRGERPSFDAWLSEQTEAAQSIVDDHLHGLKSSLESERSERKRLERELKKMVKSTDESNPLKPQLEQLSSTVSEQTTRADFYEEGHKRGIGNLRLAYHAAKFEQLIDERGRIDWDGLKERAPEVFASAPAQQKAPPGNAGKGSGHSAAGANSTTASAGINSAIRRAAGRF